MVRLVITPHILRSLNHSMTNFLGSSLGALTHLNYCFICGYMYSCFYKWIILTCSSSPPVGRGFDRSNTPIQQALDYQSVLATNQAYRCYPSQENRQKINSSPWGLYGLPTWRRDQKSKYLIAKKIGVELEIPVGFSTPKVKSFK